MPRWIRITLKFFAILIGAVLFIYMALAAYVSLHRKELLLTLTNQLNENLNGSLTIGGMDPTILRGFPSVSLTLNDVAMKDSAWNQHRHTLLQAKRLDISVNPLSLLAGTISIKKIGVSNAQIYFYTDTNGYSNTAIFRKKKSADKEKGSGSSTELRRFKFDQVRFVVDNRKGNKRFDIQVKQLEGKMDYLGDDWEANFSLNTHVNSLAFNTKKGSFIEDKDLHGPFSVHFNGEKQTITVAETPVKIGPEDFRIKATFYTGRDPVAFQIGVRSNAILWKNAHELLTPNIARRLKMFDLEKRFPVKCIIAGNMGPGAQPHIIVSALVRDNVLKTPEGTVTDCNFDGYFTNVRYKGRGANDANSTVQLRSLKGLYEGIPFFVDTAAVNNFDRPVATGVLNARFDVTKLNKVLGEDLLNFRKGTAQVKLSYKADMVDLQLTKPYVKGSVVIKDAGFSYVPRNLDFKNTSLTLRFTETDLLINNLRLQAGKSVVMLEGRVKNFLNLYYSEPGKIVLNWDIKSPQLHLGEFFGFLESRKKVRVKRKSNKATLSDNLEAAFDRSRVDMQLSVDKIYYNKFLATNAKARLQLVGNHITLSDVLINHAGGTATLNGSLSQTGEENVFKVNTKISKVDIKHFFYAFDNFGLTSLTSENLKGFLFSKTQISGRISRQGKIIKNSIRGHVIFDLKEGALLSFEPIANVGKFAFPFRDLDNINFRNLNGKFDLYGERVKINPMQISSSVLNMNVSGIYSMGQGTNIALDIPLRNPKKDTEIESKEELRKKRMRGIVLHILAVDGDDGKIKLKWNKGA